MASRPGSAGFGPRPFGRTKAIVNPIAIAGSPLGLGEPPLEVYRHALDRGINLVFWDTSFRNMTAALLELPPERRSSLFVIASIAVGGPGQIRRGILRKLKTLKLEKFGSFQLGWVRSRFRVRQSVLGELISLREEGLCDNIGLSIHKRKLAAELSARKIFDIFMVRYNAAHRGLEGDFLDKLNPEKRPSILTYTATRWRKLLERPKGWNEDLPRPGDLYRFPLSHRLVDAVCMSAQSTEQFDSNMEILTEGPLNFHEQEFIRRFGDAVHAVKTPVFGNLFEKSARL